MYGTTRRPNAKSFDAMKSNAESQHMNIEKMESYKIIDAAKAANIANVDIVKNGRFSNVLITFRNGHFIESDGEHGPNDFVGLGIKLVF